MEKLGCNEEHSWNYLTAVVVHGINNYNATISISSRGYILNADVLGPVRSKTCVEGNPCSKNDYKNVSKKDHPEGRSPYLMITAARLVRRSKSEYDESQAPRF